MLNLSCSVTIGGSDYTSHIVSISRSHDICEGMGVGQIELGTGASMPDPYDSVTIYELGTKVFTGYVVSVKKGRMPVEYSVEIADPTLLLADYWTTELYESSGETAEHWIGFFCDLAGVSYQFDTTYNRTVPDNSDGDGIEWQYSSVLTIVKDLLVIGGFYMWADPDGVVHFSDVNTGTNSNTPKIQQFRRERTLDPTRNKAIVFGRGDISASVTTTVPQLVGREKTAVVATPYIEDEGYAQDIADKMLLHFARVGDVKYLEMEGDPTLQVGQTLSYSDSWMGISGNGLVVKYSSRMTNDGYIMDVVLDEMCPFIWGYFQVAPSGVYGLYVSTAGSGVYFYSFDTDSWEHRSSGLEGDALYVRAMVLNPGHYGDPDVIHELFLATKAGLYKTADGGRSWANVTLPNPTVPSGTLTGMDYYDIVYGNQSSSTLWALTSNGSGIWVYRTDNSGSSWISRGVTITT